MKQLFIKRFLRYCGLLGLLAVVPVAGRGQSTGNWERVDLFGNVNSLNVPNFYGDFLLTPGGLVATGASPGGGYWAKYTLGGQLLWQRRTRGRYGAPPGGLWRDGIFAFGSREDNNRLSLTAEYYWLNGRGDTVIVRGAPAQRIDHLGQHAAYRDGRYYVGGGGDGTGTGQTPLALHFSLVCLDTAGNFRWQRQYLNPVIRLGPTQPAFAGGYTYLQQVLPAPRRGWLLLGHSQRDSVNFQFYAIEVDSAGAPRRTRWVEPFGRRATLHLFRPAGAVALRDGSGYVTTGTVRLDSLSRDTRRHAFVAKLDTALRVVWRTLLEAPPQTTAQATGIIAGSVLEAADGSLRVMAYSIAPGLPTNEFEQFHLNTQGQVTRRDTYCSQICTQVRPQAWALLPGDTALVAAGGAQQRAGNQPTGRHLASPAWVAYFEQPCRTRVISSARAPAAAAKDGLQLYPQPAAPGSVVTLALAGLVRGPVQVELLDALGRAVTAPATSGGPGSGELRLALPAGLAPGLYAVRVLAVGRPVSTGRLLVQNP